LNLNVRIFQIDLLISRWRPEKKTIVIYYHNYTDLNGYCKEEC